MFTHLVWRVKILRHKVVAFLFGGWHSEWEMLFGENIGQQRKVARKQSVFCSNILTFSGIGGKHHHRWMKHQRKVWKRENKQCFLIKKKLRKLFASPPHICFTNYLVVSVWPILHHHKSEPVEKSGDWSQMTPSLAAPLYTTDFARSPFIREVSYNFINIWQRQLEIYVALSASIWNIECPTMQWISRS